MASMASAKTSRRKKRRSSKRKKSRRGVKRRFRRSQLDMSGFFEPDVDLVKQERALQREMSDFLREQAYLNEDIVFAKSEIDFIETLGPPPRTKPVSPMPSPIVEFEIDLIDALNSVRQGVVDDDDDGPKGPTYH